MVIKVLFFDTDALLKKFIEEDGSKTVKWLTAPQTKVKYALHFVINEQVCSEFERKIRLFVKRNRITETTAERVLRQFLNYHKNKNFRVIGQKIISNVKKETTLDTAINELKLKRGKNDWDAIHYQSIVNALAAYGGKSHPILVSCDVKFSRKIAAKGFRVINPMKQGPDEIKLIFA